MEVFMLLTPSGHLSLAAIEQTLDKAQLLLKQEFPPGHLIFKDHRVVRVRLQLLEVC